MRFPLGLARRDGVLWWVRDGERSMIYEFRNSKRLGTRKCLAIGVQCSGRLVKFIHNEVVRNIIEAICIRLC